MITLYCGKSGAGKDAIATKHATCKHAIPIVSYTTRPMREGEQNGKDYHFVTYDQFQELIQTDALSEYRTYDTTVDGKLDTWYYGSPKLEPSKDYVGVVTLDGIASFIDTYGADVLDVIYVCTNDDIRQTRAVMRGSFDEIEWVRRRLTDDADFAIENLQNVASKLNKPIRILNNNKDHQEPIFGGYITCSKI